jgi:hypothetical protein
VVRLHGLIRAYARELTATEDDDEQRTAAAQRLVTWYVDTLCAAGLHLVPHGVDTGESPSLMDGVEPLVFTDDVEARAWLDTERANFESVTTMALEYGPPGAAHTLAMGLQDVALFGQADDDAGGPQDSSPEALVPTQRLCSKWS